MRLIINMLNKGKNPISVQSDPKQWHGIYSLCITYILQLVHHLHTNVLNDVQQKVSLPGQLCHSSSGKVIFQLHLSDGRYAVLQFLRPHVFKERVCIHCTPFQV